MQTDLTDDLALALRMADDADTITMARFGAADLVVDAKPDLTPVSDADQAVERMIREHLGRERPADSLIGEEFGSSGSSNRRWIIDPIDGTKNFVRNVPAWATLIALLRPGRAVGRGGLGAGALGRRWWAARGGRARGSRRFDAPPRPIQVSKVARLADASLSYASLSGWIDRGLGEAFLALTQQAWRTRAYGDFWSYMLLAEGAVDLAAEPELAVWDMAALVPIVLEAGGRFTGLDGVPGPFQGNAAASNGLLHDAAAGGAAVAPRPSARSDRPAA